ncbi:MAG: glutathione S-transferase family protein [Alphaproteobacteria bacterium]|nr:glutathione S-transferase family protein [Alphaproteobacteria bacterium]
MITVYGCPQTRSTRVVWALEEIGAPYDYVYVDLAKGEQKKSPLIDVNPYGAVPALKDDDVALWESAAIVAYLGDKFPHSGITPPADRLALRGAYLQWAFFAAVEVERHVATIANHTLFLPEAKRAPGVVPLAKEGFERCAATLAQHLANRKFLVGEHFTGVDILTSSILNWARSMKLTTGPRLDAYAKEMASRPAFQRARDKEQKAKEARG